jgi:hypothetical protein
LRKPLAIDLYAGLGGWTDGLLAEGFDVVGFDIQRHIAFVPETLPDADGYKNTKPVEGRGWTQGCAIAMGIEGPNAKPRTRRVEYPAQLVLQDVTTIHGSQFKNADLIVASPPCQKYSWLAMPWSRSKCPMCQGTKIIRVDWLSPDQPCHCKEQSRAAKELRRKWKTEGPDNALFDACFRIQREAIEATRKDCLYCDGVGLDRDEPQIHLPCKSCGGKGYTERYIPLVVENVRGAVPWVGPPKAMFKSFYLWGDVASIGNRVVAGYELAEIQAGRGRFGMGVAPVRNEQKGKTNFHFYEKTGLPSPSWHGAEHEPSVARAISGVKVGGRGRREVGADANDFFHIPHELRGTENQMTRGERDSGIKVGGYEKSGSWKVDGKDWRDPSVAGIKQPGGNGDWFSKEARDSGASARYGSKSSARKQASAQIAKIPLALSQYIAQVYYPR